MQLIIHTPVICPCLLAGGEGQGGVVGRKSSVSSVGKEESKSWWCGAREVIHAPVIDSFSTTEVHEMESSSSKSVRTCTTVLGENCYLDTHTLVAGRYVNNKVSFTRVRNMKNEPL